MPTWDKIIQEFDQKHLELIKDYVEDLSKLTQKTTICYFTAFTVVKPPAPSHFYSIIDADMQGFMTCSNQVNKDNLDLILHTPGGDLEATKQIISYLRGIYKNIRVIIPQKAMSGGTIISCAADEILMGPYSALGPTNPQIYIDGNFVPIDSVLDEFQDAFADVAKDPAKALLWNQRLAKIPIGSFRNLENMKKNSEKYLADLLEKYMLKNKRNKKKEAVKISKFLHDSKKHSSHGRTIGINEANDLGLIVKDLSADDELEDKVLSIYHVLLRMLEMTNVYKIIVNNDRKVFLNEYPS